MISSVEEAVFSTGIHWLGNCDLFLFRIVFNGVSWLIETNCAKSRGKDQGKNSGEGYGCSQTRCIYHFHDWYSDNSANITEILSTVGCYRLAEKLRKIVCELFCKLIQVCLHQYLLYVHTCVSSSFASIDRKLSSNQFHPSLTTEYRPTNSSLSTQILSLVRRLWIYKFWQVAIFIFAAIQENTRYR